MKRGQITEHDLLGQFVRLLIVDRLDPKQCEIFFAFLRRTNLGTRT